MSTRFSVNFSNINTISDLALAIGASDSLVAKTIELNDAGGPPTKPPDGGLVEWNVLVPGSQPAYFSTRLHKKNRRRRGEYRTVWVIDNPELANAQKALLRRLYNYLEDSLADFPSACVHGYVRRRSTLSNATAHVGARLLLNADIENFFPTITSERVASVLNGAGLTPAGAQLIARFITIGGTLPLGFNASPLLANLACGSLDQLMLRVAIDHACVYTRYADDFTFSGMERLPSRQCIEDALATEGFKLAVRKFRTSKRGQRHFVTGLSVADSIAPRLPKHLKRRLRQELYYCEKFGIGSHVAHTDRNREAGINQIDGRIAYARGIEPGVGDALSRKWQQLLRRDDLTVVYPPRPNRAPNKVHMYFDESTFDSVGASIFCVCCVVVDDPDGIRQQTDTLIKYHIADPFSSGRKTRLEKCGLHYADDSEEIRTDFVKLLAGLPVRAFLAYGVRSKTLSYADAYVNQFRSLLLHRFYAADGREVEVVYEENSQAQHSVVEAALSDLYNALKWKDSRRPHSNPKLVRASKESDVLLALPDYFLGVFRGYALCDANPNKHELSTKRFERLRDRLRLIISLNSGMRYSRHNPFLPWTDGNPISQA